MSFANTELKDILPPFPRISHWPYKPNADATDIVATEAEVQDKRFRQAIVTIEEKIDGASVGMSMVAGEPVIRNRDHILRKGYLKDTAAKKQFRPIWNWWYEKKDSFKKLTDFGPYSVYGEWCLAQHGLKYTRLPSYFIAYEVYDFDRKTWLWPVESRQILERCDFTVVPLKFRNDSGWWYSHKTLEIYCNDISAYNPDEKAEGVVFKAVYSDLPQFTNTKIARFKMVREDFVRGAHWDPETITKNKLRMR